MLHRPNEPTAEELAKLPVVVAVAVLDTNIVLDLFLFQDPHCSSLRQSLESGQLHWIATPHMRNELERVLAYSHIAVKLDFYKKTSTDILSQFDRFARIAPEPMQKAPYICKDADDQVFIDLAHTLALAIRPSERLSDRRIILHSKDKAILSMRKRLEKLSICVSAPKMA